MKLELTNEVKIVIWQIGNAAMMCKDDDITSAEYEKISLDAINGLVNVDEKSDSNCNLDIVNISEAEVCDHNWKEWEDEICNAQMRCTKCKEVKQS